MSIYNLPTSQSDLSSVNDGASRTHYLQVQPTRDVTTGNFSNGSIHIRWTNSSNEWTYLPKSYFRIRFSVADNAGFTAPLANAEGMFPTMDLAACLFQSMEFRINGTTVSRCSNFVAQTDMWVKRVKKSGSEIRDTTERTELTDANDTNRKTLTDDNGSALIDFELCWQPMCLGIWDINHALPVGDYEIVLNPQTANTIAKTVISAAAEKTQGVDFYFQVDDMYLYLHQSEGARVDNASYFIDLDEYNIQSEDVGQVALTQKHFQVPPSTVALAVAYQDGRTLTSSIYQPTKLEGEADVERELNRFYIQYAGRSFPSPDADPSFDANIDRTTQRYLETLLESGTYFESGGVETVGEWQLRGQYYYFRTNKDGKSQDTRLTVNSQFAAGADVSNLRVLVMSQFKRLARVQIKNGRVVSVVSEEL